MPQENTADIAGLTQDQFMSLKPETRILVRNIFNSDPTWYRSVVTRGPFPDSIAPAIHFKMTDERMKLFDREMEFVYYFSDAFYIAYDPAKSN